MRKGYNKITSNRIYITYSDSNGKLHLQGKRQIDKYKDHPLIKVAVKEKSKIAMVKFIRGNYKEYISLRTALDIVNAIMIGSHKDFLTTMEVLDTEFTYCGPIESSFSKFKKFNLAEVLLLEEELKLIETSKLKTMRTSLKELVFAEMYSFFKNQPPSILIQNFQAFSKEIIRRT